MSMKTACVTLEGGQQRFVARSGSGHSIVLDDSTGDTGMRPAELLPIAVAGPTAMDVIATRRKKQQVAARYEVQVSGERIEANPAVFSRIDLVHVVDGAVAPAALRRAIELSATLCRAVGGTRSTGVTAIQHAYLRRGVDGTESAADVFVTGPHRDPAALDRMASADAS